MRTPMKKKLTIKVCKKPKNAERLISLFLFVNSMKIHENQQIIPIRQTEIT